MSEPILGLLIEGEASRDAIHVALAPVTSDQTLNPGQRVALVKGRSDLVEASNSDTIGIVDPYLRSPVQPGQRFWLCLYCRTVTSLRHQWTHPAFPEEMSTMVDKAASVRWINEYSHQVGLSYEELMDGAEEYQKDGDLTSTGDRDEDTDPAFWDHWEIVTGRKVDHRDNFFRCAC